MALRNITEVTGRAVPVPGDDVDTDRIIPARFMKCVTFDGLGQYAFYDARFNEDGLPKPHPLNESRYEGATVLIAGSNFGCGSSREHAPQSLSKFGIEAIIGKSFAEIFFGNATTLGMPCVTVDDATHARLSELAEASPEQALTIDIANKQITFGADTFACAIVESAREALVGGNWEPIALMLEAPEDVAAVASRLDYV